MTQIQADKRAPAKLFNESFAGRLPLVPGQDGRVHLTAELGCSLLCHVVDRVDLRRPDDRATSLDAEGCGTPVARASSVMVAPVLALKRLVDNPVVLLEGWVAVQRGVTDASLYDGCVRYYAELVSGA